MTIQAKEKHQNKRPRKNFLLLFLVCSFFLFALLYFWPRTPDSPSEPEPQLPIPTFEAPVPTEIPDVSENETVSSPQITDLPDSLADYDFANPVPVSTAVDMSYFDDALFIGDSRTEGFMLTLDLTQIHSFTHKGLMVNTVFTDAVIELEDRRVTVMDAIRETPFSKVYIMLGINELGWTYSSKFIEKYGLLIDEIKAVNPDAIIYIQSLLPVSQTVSNTHDYVKNDKIQEYNALLAALATEKQVFFLDTAASVIDENGCLPEDAATDGIHLKKAYCEKWLQYLLTHTVLTS